MDRKRECPKHSQIHLNPKINPKNTGLKWSVMIYPCASVISVFHFRPVDIAEGWWTPYYHWNIFFQCCRCVPSLRRGHKSKKETRISQTWHGSVFHGSFFDNIWVSDSWIWLWIYWDLRVLTHSLSWRYRYCYSAYRHQPPPNLKPILTFPKDNPS